MKTEKQKAATETWRRAHLPHVKEYARRYRQDYPDTTRDTLRRNRLKRSYGLTVEQFDRMVAAQGGICKLCHRPPKAGKYLHVDHDHESKRVRGGCCWRCNRLRLSIAKDSEVELYRRIVAYLESDFDARNL